MNEWDVALFKTGKKKPRVKTYLKQKRKQPSLDDTYKTVLKLKLYFNFD